MRFDNAPNPISGSQGEIVARELGYLSERIVDAAATARGLAAATDWRARAAEAFHVRAEGWAGEVSSLVCTVETARLEAVRARDAAAATRAAGLW
jgi:hypothetical protein